MIRFPSSTDNNLPVPAADVLAVPRTEDFVVYNFRAEIQGTGSRSGDTINNC